MAFTFCPITSGLPVRRFKTSDTEICWQYSISIFIISLFVRWFWVGYWHFLVLFFPSLFYSPKVCDNGSSRFKALYRTMWILNNQLINKFLILSRFLMKNRLWKAKLLAFRLLLVYIKEMHVFQILSEEEFMYVILLFCDRSIGTYIVL